MVDAKVETGTVADCFLRVDCGAVSRNLNVIRSKTKSRIMAVVKHGGYGLSLVEYARLLTGLGIEELAAGTCEEALTLRCCGIGVPVLLLTPQVSAEAVKELLRKGIMLTVGSAGQADAVRQAAEETGIEPKIHVKIDTGLGRYGFLPDALKDAGKAIAGMDVRGVYTHFSSPYANRRITYKQYAAFLQAVDQLKCLGVQTGELHCCASGGLLNYPEMHMDIVRIGSALIGRVPDAEKHGLVQASSLLAPVTAIKPPSALRIGYRGTVGLKRIALVGVLSMPGAFAMPPARRAFGLFREKQYAMINGCRAEVLGPLGIGALAVDLSGVRCKEGDLAKLNINPLHCAGFVRRIFDYGAEGCTESAVCAPQAEAGRAGLENGARAAVSCKDIANPAQP